MRKHVVYAKQRLLIIGVATCQLWGTGARAPSTSNNFFSVNFRAAVYDSEFVRLPLQTYLYSATAAAALFNRGYI